jgi:hypothetical protein
VEIDGDIDIGSNAFPQCGDLLHRAADSRVRVDPLIVTQVTIGYRFERGAGEGGPEAAVLVSVGHRDLLSEEIGQRDREMQSGRRSDGNAVMVWRDRDAVGLREGGKLADLGDAVTGQVGRKTSIKSSRSKS